MGDGPLDDRLDRTIDAILERGDATAALRDPELSGLARIAADLIHCPNPGYTARLRARLERRTAMAATLVSSRIREGFTTVTPYIRTAEPGLADFLSRALGATETLAMRGSAGGMHRELRIGNSMIMIGEGGTTGIRPPAPAALHVYVEDADATFERALAAGASSLGAPQERPYGERSGFVRDPFGNHWYIATHLGASYMPEGVRTITPFVHAPGAAQYLEFLKRAFGTAEEHRHDVEGLIRYARLRIGNAALELGEAEGEAMAGAYYLYVDDADLLYEQALAAGARSLWAPTDQPYGDRMAGVEDTIGAQWFIARPL